MNTYFDEQRIETEYFRCISELNQARIISYLPNSSASGIIGIDENEYPVPTMEQVQKLFTVNQELVNKKAKQGFDTLQLTPVAISTLHLIDLLKDAILKHQKSGQIFQTSHDLINALKPIRVNKEKQVWIWETLKQAIETGELVYFPQAYSSINHGGLTKSETIINSNICAVPGWSLAIIENLSNKPILDESKIIGGRKQLETEQSPFEYLQNLKSEDYQGETGLILEDFLTKFLIRLETTNEVSNEVEDNNALWLLGHYLKISYADVVPTGRWIRSVGRLRLDMHRTKNKKCTESWGASTAVRLVNNDHGMNSVG